MADYWADKKQDITCPPDVHFAITPSNTTDLPIVPRKILWQTNGDVVVRDRLGTDITYTRLAGSELVFRGVRILSTGTTATVVGHT